MLRKILSTSFASLVLFLAGCVSSPEIQIAPLDNSSRLAIISAFEPETKKLLREAQISDTYTINGRSFHLGKLANNEVVLFQSGVSMVNAAMTTQTAAGWAFNDYRSRTDNFKKRSIPHAASG